MSNTERSCAADGLVLYSSWTRIRLGIALRLLGVPLLLGAAIWALALGARLAFAGVLFLPAAALIGMVTRHDLARLGDLRHGQPTRLEAVDGDGVHLVVSGAPVIVPLDAISGAATAEGLDARGVLVVVTHKERISGDANRLAWAASNDTQDVFFITEHQANMDGEALKDRIVSAVAAARERYR